MIPSPSGLGRPVVTSTSVPPLSESFDAVIAASHNVAGPIWSLGKTLTEGARSAAQVG